MLVDVSPDAGLAEIETVGVCVFVGTGVFVNVAVGPMVAVAAPVVAVGVLVEPAATLI